MAFVEIKFDGKISFDPRSVGSKGVKSYAIGAYKGKNKQTGASEYMNFEVVDWDNVSGGKFKKGDYVHVEGRFTTGSYVAKDGSARTTLNVTPKIMYITEFDAGAGAAAAKPAAAGADELPF